jgi:LysM repeat protein
MLRRALATSAACSLGGLWLATGAATAAVPHTVLPGESFWSISSANGLSVSALAAYNGMTESSTLIAGTTISVPTVGVDVAAAPAPATTAAPAEAWNAMRAEALSAYGVDLYPGGPASALRTYAQQAELYQAFLAGYGAPANPPGSSSHEYGTAVDVPTTGMRSVIDQIGWKYGWGKAHAPGEWWHVDYVGG